MQKTRRLKRQKKERFKHPFFGILNVKIGAKVLWNGPLISNKITFKTNGSVQL